MIFFFNICETVQIKNEPTLDPLAKVTQDYIVNPMFFYSLTTQEIERIIKGMKTKKTNDISWKETLQNIEKRKKQERFQYIRKMI